MTFTAVTIIYNPNSTGPSAAHAKQLADQLVDSFPDLQIDLMGTKRPGHAQDIAYTQAQKTSRPLIISSSGDGGYNEVINGVMEVRRRGSNPVCMVLAAGNANDHSRTIYDRPILDVISDGQIRKLDLMKISYVSKGRKLHRYAHSYIGFGLTPEVARSLNQTDLNPLKEKVLALKTFVEFQPISIIRRGKAQELDSLICTTIGEMAKLLTLAKHARPDDGKFEVAVFPHDKKAKLVGNITKAALLGLKHPKSYKSYSFQTTSALDAQLDGEVIAIDSRTRVHIQICKQALETLR